MDSVRFFFFLLILPHPRSTRRLTLFPYTTLFRSGRLVWADRDEHRGGTAASVHGVAQRDLRSVEHTSELQSPIDISYAVFCLKKKIRITTGVKFAVPQERVETGEEVVLN